MHPLCMTIEAALEGHLDFWMEIGGDPETRMKMGIPAAIAEQRALVLAFPAQYHRNSMPTGDEHGLTCALSFDDLYHCRLPWSTIRQVVIQYQGDESWPSVWDEDPDSESTQEVQPPLDNVRLLRPIQKRTRAREG